MFGTFKRKNDDKPKRRIGLSLSAVAILVVLFVSGATVYVLMRPASATNDFPTARLQYDSDSGTYILNLQTGERGRIYVDATLTSPVLSASERVPNTPRQQSWTHSPDGVWIAYWDLITEYYEWKLMYKSATGNYTRDLGVFISNGSRLSWSPDNQWIAFSAYPEITETMLFNQEELWMVNFETAERKRLTDNDFGDGDPAFSPDGTQIAYTSAADGYNRLYIMDVASGESRLLTPESHGYHAAWSPDGRWIAFTTTSLDLNGDIWIIRADGTGVQAITTGPTRDDNPSWLP